MTSIQYCPSCGKKKKKHDGNKDDRTCNYCGGSLILTEPYVIQNIHPPAPGNGGPGPCGGGPSNPPSPPMGGGAPPVPGP